MLHLVEQFQMGGEGLTRPSTAPSSERRISGVRANQSPRATHSTGEFAVAAQRPSTPSSSRPCPFHPLLQEPAEEDEDGSLPASPSHESSPGHDYTDDREGSLDGGEGDDKGSESQIGEGLSDDDDDREESYNRVTDPEAWDGSDRSRDS
eukprot:gene21870-28902_t